MNETHAARVARYYDGNSASFLRFGQGGADLAIHRAVWGPGVQNRRDAHQYVNRLILQRLPTDEDPRVLDLGCGVGGSLLSLAEARSDLRGAGLTLSRVQAQIGAKFLGARGLQDRIQVLVGDMAEVESYNRAAGTETFQAAYAIESFIHVENIRGVLSALAQCVAEGSKLIVCDDFMAESADPSDKATSELLGDLRRGWHTYGLRRVSELMAIAESHGFVLESDENLSDFLELGRPRDSVIAVLSKLLRGFKGRLPWVQNLVGGTALQRLLRNGALEYRFLVFGFHG